MSRCCHRGRRCWRVCSVSPGGIHALNADPNMAAFQAYTIDLLYEVEKEPGIDIGLHMTVACDPNRWEWLQVGYVLGS